MIGFFGIILSTFLLYQKCSSTVSNKQNNYEFLKLPEFITMENVNLLLYGTTFHKHTDNVIFLFDIDNTLYKVSNELHNEEIRCNQSAVSLLKARTDFINIELSYDDFLDSNGRLILQKIYDVFKINPNEFERLRQIDYSKFIEKDDSLIAYLSKSKHRLWCFTNGLKPRAKTILSKLGIEQYFEEVICTDEFSRKPVKKPYLEAYKFVSNLLGEKKNIYFFDDLTINLIEAEKMGWNVFHISEEVDLLRKVSLVESVLDKLNN